MISDGFSQDDYITKQEAIFCSRKWTVALYKQFLYLLEDLRKDHDINFKKLSDSFPKDNALINMANYLDDEKFSFYRKRILDLGNEISRNLERDLEKL